MKKRIYAALSVILIIAVATTVYFELNKQVLKAERVWGTGIDRQLNKYYILNSDYSEIRSTSEHFAQMQDNSYVNIDYSVVYEQNKWLSSRKKALKLLRFEIPFPEDELQQADTMYYKLLDESIDQLDDNYTVFTRLYAKYEQNHHLFGLEPLSIVIPRVDSVREARSHIQSNKPEFMKLPPLTAVETNVKETWSKDNYIPNTEYSMQSPEHLSVQNIIDTKHE